MNANSTLKFLQYQFNTFTQVQGKPPLEIRHSVIADNDYALVNLQNKDWQLTVFDDSSSESDIFEKSFEEINYCKDYYQSLFDNTAYFFHLYIQQTHDIFVEKMEEDIRRELYFHKPLKSIENPMELLKVFTQFFFKMGRFPTSKDITIVSMGVMSPFVKTNEVISSFDLYEKFDFTSVNCLVSTRFLAAFNIFKEGDKTISKNAMKEFFHNLSMQALSKNEDRIKTKFDAIEDLNKSIRKLLKDEANRDISFIDFRPKQFEEIKDPNQLFEKNVVENIINGYLFLIS